MVTSAPLAGLGHRRQVEAAARRSARRSRAAWAGSRPPGRCCAARSLSAMSLSASLPLALLTIRCVPMPRPAIANTFLPSTSRLARTHSSHRMQRLKSSRMSGWRGVHRAVGIELLEVRAVHAQLVGHGLQQAVAALLAGGAEVVALDEQHLQQRLALRVQLLGVGFSTSWPAAAGSGAGRAGAAVDLDGAQRQEPCGAKSGCQHRCGM